MGFNPTQFGLLDFQVREFCANKRKRDFDTGACIGCTTDNLMFFGAAADPANNEFVCIRVSTGFEYFTDDHLVERCCYRVEAIDFKARHG